MKNDAQKTPVIDKQVEERVGLPRKTIAVAKGSMLAVLRPIWALLGVFFIIIGVPIAFLSTVLPIGLPIVILGVVLLARNSSVGRRWMQNTIAKHPSLKRFAPSWLLNLIFGGKAH